ncbi:hypothetical protein WMY93_008858 [Mugilogobius chulae]|uniref:Apple domain-containing protein n=1 Tax=Mugilogobius chulae TaxID=88201 RepID=A0AAW0P9S0_9GOBI
MNPRLTLVVISSCIALCLGCSSRLRANTEIEGKRFETKGSPDAFHCQTLCTFIKRCEAFTFRSREFKCDMKESAKLDKFKSVPGSISGETMRNCPYQKPCFTQTYRGLAFTDKPYKSVRLGSENDCQTVCKRDPFCSFYTFYTSKRRCDLKFWKLVPTVERGRMEGLISGYSSKLRLEIGRGYQCGSLQYHDYLMEGKWWNYEYNGFAFNVEHCQTLCNLNPFCRIYAYHIEYKLCRLKVVQDKDKKMIHKKGYISGPRATSCRISFNWLDQTVDGYFYSRREEPTPSPSVKECKTLCDNNPRCNFYTYATEKYKPNAKECFLYYDRELPSPTVVADNSAVSGLP